MRGGWARRGGLPRLVALSLPLFACQPSFDPGSELRGLRVMAVQKSSPYVLPGETVDLQMLWHDAGTERRDPRVPDIAWLAICENPPSDLFELCLAEQPNLTPAQLAERFSPPGPGNERFSFTSSADLISSRPPPKDPTARRYGLTYVFFAACAGTLAAADGGADDPFPFVCYEEADGVDGFTAGDRQLSSEDFVVGYSAVFAYEQSVNDNPVITGVDLDGLTLLPEGSEAPAEGNVLYLGPDDLCVGRGCAGVVSEDPGSCPPELTFDACAGDCSELEIQPRLDPASAEIDDTTAQRRSGSIEEQMWINYYVTDGELDGDVRLLNDATRGWNDSHGTKYKPSEEPGMAYAWAVAHDNRGGADWARLRFCTR